MVSLEQQKKERIERLVWSCRELPSPPPLPECRPHLRALSHFEVQLSGWGYSDFIPVPYQGYDPDAKAPFQPKAKQKGRSSTASLVKRKKKVMDQEHRVCEWRVAGVSLKPSLQPASAHFVLCSPFCVQDKVRQSLEQQQQQKQETTKPPRARPSALDRFVR